MKANAAASALEISDSKRRNMHDHMLLRYLQAINSDDSGVASTLTVDAARTLVQSWAIHRQVQEISTREDLWVAWSEDPLQQVLVYHTSILPNEKRVDSGSGNGGYGGSDRGADDGLDAG